MVSNMLSSFFVKRPVFSIVISVVIVMMGLTTMQNLPVAQYPEIAPPQVQVTASYPGASAKVLANTVAQPIEEQVNGVEGMIYLSSTSTNDGQYTLDVTFEVGTDLDMAQVQVQNRVAQAEALLPQEVQRMGVKVTKQSTNILLFASFMSPDGSRDDLFLSNYVSLKIQNQIKRIPGVGQAMVFGAGNYSMRVWLNPDSLKARELTTADVIGAIREQNVQVAAGQVGQLPAKKHQSYQYPINVKGRLADVGEFENIVVKELSGGRLIRIKDVATVELGAMDYGMSSKTNGQISASLGVFLKPGANALSVANSVKSKLEELSKDFPTGVNHEISFDTTLFVQKSIDEVVETLFITVILVVLVILLFLQNWRASIIPVLTIPVSLIGTLGVMYMLGVSINMLSLFGLVLAIGIVVDDAIVVVENVIRHVTESGVNSIDATIRAMKEVSGPVIATTLVLLSVFVPTAFMGGTTGELYRQFALTISVATVFSSINALTLSPALSALFFRKGVGSGGNNFIARGFNSLFDKVQKSYGKLVASLLRRGVVVLLLFGIISFIASFGFFSIPKGFIPNEDQGWAIITVQLPDSASLDRTKDVTDVINDKLSKMDGIDNFVAVPGLSVMDMSRTSNAAVFWVVFDSWEERMAKGLNLDRMIGQMYGAVAPIEEAVIYVFPPPPILGMGVASGFSMQLEDRGGKGPAALQNEAFKIMMKANQHPELMQVFTTFKASVPQLNADVDRTHVKSLGLKLSDVFETLQANMGSIYVNDFNIYGKNYQVRVQAAPEYRSTPEDISRLEVRNSSGKMVPLGTVTKIEEALGPQTIPRYNLYTAAKFSGQGVPGISSGRAMDIMKQIAKENLSEGFDIEWTEMSYQEQYAGSQTGIILIMAVIFVYLVLCAQYESWTLPGSVIFSIPLAFIGTIVAVFIRGMDINVYTQIGLILLVALTCKTSILITEFAKAGRDSGMSIFDAAMNAARLRLRPVLMTALTFILGMLPLVIATGAGANSRQALGTAVFSGMLSAIILLVLFVPSFYTMIQRVSERFGGSKKKEVIETPAAGN